MLPPNDGSLTLVRHCEEAIEKPPTKQSSGHEAAAEVHVTDRLVAQLGGDPEFDGGWMTPAWKSMARKPPPERHRPMPRLREGGVSASGLRERRFGVGRHGWVGC